MTATPEATSRPSSSPYACVTRQDTYERPATALHAPESRQAQRAQLPMPATQQTYAQKDEYVDHRNTIMQNLTGTWNRHTNTLPTLALEPTIAALLKSNTGSLEHLIACAPQTSIDLHTIMAGAGSGHPPLALPAAEEPSAGGRPIGTASAPTHRVDGNLPDDAQSRSTAQTPSKLTLWERIVAWVTRARAADQEPLL